MSKATRENYTKALDALRNSSMAVGFTDIVTGNYIQPVPVIEIYVAELERKLGVLAIALADRMGEL